MSEIKLPKNFIFDEDLTFVEFGSGSIEKISILYIRLDINCTILIHNRIFRHF